MATMGYKIMPPILKPVVHFAANIAKFYDFSHGTSRFIWTIGRTAQPKKEFWRQIKSTKTGVQKHSPALRCCSEKWFPYATA